LCLIGLLVGGFSSKSGTDSFKHRHRDYAYNSSVDGQIGADGASTDNDMLSARVECNNASASTSDSDGDGFGLGVKYYQNANNGTADVDFHYKLCGIVEFIESGQTPGYQKKEDEFVKHYTISGWGHWKNVAPSQAAYLAYQAASDDRIFSIAFYLTSTNATVNGVYIDSNGYKLDLNITNFQYKKANSQLALCAHIDADDHVTWNITGNQFEISGKSGQYIGYMNWVDHVDTNNGRVNLITTYNNNGSNSRIFYTVNTTTQPTQIMWDPAMGVQSTNSAASLFFVSLTSLFMALLGYLIQ